MFRKVRKPAQVTGLPSRLPIFAASEVNTGKFKKNERGTAAVPSELLLRKVFSGGSGIRTHERLAASPVFKTGAINRSAIPPDAHVKVRQDSLPLAHNAVKQTGQMLPMRHTAHPAPRGSQ